MVGISNFPLIWSIRTLSLLPCRGTRNPLKATPLFQNARDSCALDSSNRIFDAIPSLASPLIVDIGQIRELVFQRNSLRRKPPRLSRAARDCHPSQLSTIAENAFSGKRARDAACPGILKRDISERRRRDAHVRISLKMSFCTLMCSPRRMCSLPCDQISDPPVCVIDKKVLKARLQIKRITETVIVTTHEMQNVSSKFEKKKICRSGRSRPDLKWCRGHFEKCRGQRDEISFYTDQSKRQFYFGTISIYNIFYFESAYHYYAWSIQTDLFLLQKRNLASKNK